MESTQFALRDTVSWAPTDNDAIVVLDLRTSTYLSLNASGSVLWQALNDGATASQLADLLVDRFGITRERAEMDVTDFLDMLRGRDLVAER